MVESGVNCPVTSSCGRLFDAVSALVGIRLKVNYEAQAAIELEMSIDHEAQPGSYPFDLKRDCEMRVIDSRRAFESMLMDVDVPTSVVSQRFHNGLIDVFTQLAQLLRSETSLERVCLSGGSFHNAYLLTHLHRRLQRSGFEVFTHRDVPAGDGGLSLGQAMIAAHRVRNQ